MITDEQAKQIKEQLFTQLVNFPEDKRDQIKDQISKLSNQELEEFLKQNQLMQEQQDQEGNQEETPELSQEQAQQQCVFCNIVEGKIPSYKIAEDENNIAILEINPTSKAHTLIIPKEHFEDKVPESTTKLADEISEKIKQALSPTEIQIIPNKITNHSILEVIPLYEGQDAKELKREKAEEKDLQELQKTLTLPQQTKPEPIKIEKPKKPKKTKPVKLKPRIP